MLSRWSIPALLAFSMLISSSRADDQVQDIELHSSHQQTKTIQIGPASGSEMQVNAFCLNSKGQILAACGNGPGEIRVYNDDAELLRSWAVSVKPEAINTAADDSILVGGQGQLFHFAADGQLIKSVESPHTLALKKDNSELRTEAIESLKREQEFNTVFSMEARIESYEQIIETLKQKEKTEELNDQEKSLLIALPKTLEVWEKELERLKKEEAEETEDDQKNKGPSEEQIAQQIESMINYKKRIASVSTDGDSIFVATPAFKGYGFAIWKMNAELEEGQQIVTGLSGCCGQMDVQACKNGIYVAENSRKRVVCYDANGEQKLQWGKSDRTGIDGFTSCCNPMNVCFNQAGDVFTAESSTGRIKRFDAAGNFLNYVGDVKLVPGCKNVSIAVTPDHSKVYMLDITRNHIVLMEQKPEGYQEGKPQPADPQPAANNVQAEDVIETAVSIIRLFVTGQ